jgi:hypothetical protein
VSWQCVGRTSHPIPANVPVLTSESERLKRVAAKIRDQAERLKLLSDDKTWDSDAAKNFKEVSKKLPERLTQLAVRYEKTSGAVSEFAATAKTAKDEAEAGRAEAQQALVDRQQAEQRIAQREQWDRDAKVNADRVNAANPEAPPVQPRPWPYEDPVPVRDAAQRRLNSATTKVNDAIVKFNAAAETAATAINAASDDGLKNDRSFWGVVKWTANWLSERLPLDMIYKIASTIAMIAGLIALLVPGPWSIVFGAVAIVAGVIALAAVVIKVLGKSHRGEHITVGDWIDIGLAALAVLPGVGAVAKGLSRSGSFAAGTAARVATFGNVATKVGGYGSKAANIVTTARDIANPDKGLVETVMNPAGALALGIGVITNGRAPNGVDEAVDVAGGLYSTYGQATADRDARELEERNRQDARTFTPQPIVAPAPEPAPAPSPSGPAPEPVPTAAPATPSSGSGMTGARTYDVDLPMAA